MRIHCLENVDKSLTFLNEQRVHLENMGAHDIVDGNPRLTLGLIWTIILRFQVWIFVCQNASMVFWPYVMTFVHQCLSSITKWGNSISGEWFDLESPTFTWTSIPVGSTTNKFKSLATSGWQLSTASGEISWEQFKSEDHEILHAYHGQSAPQIYWIWHNWLFPVGCEKQRSTAQNCVKRVQPA